MDAWLTFLSNDDPEAIEALIQAYPMFKPMYDQVYEMCLNIERVMEMFSKELLEMDRNTVQYMIDEMQETINKQNQSLLEKDQSLSEKQQQLDSYEAELKEKERLYQEALKQIAQLEKEQKSD